MVDYIPDQGDIIEVCFDPQTGNEIKKNRPALILSLKSYNKKRGMAIVAPLTSKTKNYPLEVIIEAKPIKGSPRPREIMGFVVPDQIKAIDWKKRHVKYLTKASEEEVQQTLEKLIALFGIEF